MKQIELAPSVVLYDHEPADTFEQDVLEGLSSRPKRLPCKYFYDEEGSRLFERICELEEYYPTRTELSIMRAHVDEMAVRLGPRVRLVELGAGAGVKTRLLLDHLEAPACYVPIDIGRDMLLRTAETIAKAHPDIVVQPVCADYTRRVTLPEHSGHRATVAYFPGSTIGNFARAEAVGFLSRLARLVGRRGGLLLGADLVKDREVLERAYDDAQGLTARFNRNLLVRIRRELGAELDVDAFTHCATWNPRAKRIEIHLVSQREQRARISKRTFRFAAGEAIHTEDSHKYELEDLEKLARAGGFEVREVWTDPARWFAVAYLEVQP